MRIAPVHVQVAAVYDPAIQDRVAAEVIPCDRVHICENLHIQCVCVASRPARSDTQALLPWRKRERCNRATVLQPWYHNHLSHDIRP